MPDSTDQLDNPIHPSGSGAEDQPQPPTHEISDSQFMADLEKIRELRSFLIEQAVHLKPTESGVLSFGTLNLLRRGIGGRRPSQEEWQALETLTQELFGHLSDPLRRRFVYSRLPWWVPHVVVGSGCLAIFSLILSAFFWGSQGYEEILGFYVLWLASMGAIGSVSFIGMNALSVQDDATFDISNTKLLSIRISLGSLFGIVLTLPFGFESFTTFIGSLQNGGRPAAAAAGEVAQHSGDITQQSLLLLLPFVLGFSTSLVIMILNQFVEAIQSFFGRKSGGAAASFGNAAPTPPVAPIPPAGDN